MVGPFIFSRLPVIHFGPAKIDNLATIAAGYGRSALLVTGSASFIASPMGEKVLKSLAEKGIRVRKVQVTGEPSPAIVDKAVSENRAPMPDVVIAIGGGSALDAGKAISAMLLPGGNLKDYLEGVGTREHPGQKVPFIAVPTTAGTGSEATKNAVISEVGSNGFKKSLRHENFVPDVAVVDPLLTVTCSPEITAASGMDCFTQLTEAYLSTKANPMTDALALKGIEAVARSLPEAFRDGKNTGARAGMSFAALLSGICLANAGLGAVHGFSSAVGAIYEVPHGIVCGTLMAKANEVNVRALRRDRSADRALARYSEMGKIVLGEEGRTEDYYIDGFIDYLFRLTDELRLPPLGRFGVMKADIPGICMNTDLKNNPVKLTQEELAEIVESRI
ncbi:MAG TPA: iron-containing alcohol dehydrogenase [Bacteroidales bacterium]|nr:iron-containing alcohol dehydrogenase [Bacteroidales bacterium]HRR93715.1 iron-containing alcohol dehydrogenase [Bacteroidales bacterium]HRT90055.1 iron-containing alcohol dehydrogenase [Bacteroidales bacterium]